MTKRLFRDVLLAMLLLPTAAASGADCSAMAGQTIRWIVPSLPGGGYDAYSRLIQPFLEQRLDARIVIENRPQAGGIVGAISIRDAHADGTTLGIINSSGLLAAGMIADSRAPDPLRDFTILARVTSNRMVLFTGRNSGISHFGDLLQITAERPVVAGVRDAGSASFFTIPVMATLLGIDYTLVTGYVGSASRALAAIRGDVDVIVQNLDSVRRFIDSGELLPLLKITENDSLLVGKDPLPSIPSLDGPEGLASQRAATLGVDPQRARSRASALSGMMSAGRLLVAPAGLPEPIERCLQSATIGILQSTGLKQAADRAGLTINPADNRVASKSLRASKRHIDEFAAIVRSTIEQARQ